MTIGDLRSALQGAIRQGELNARELIETALIVRDLKTAIRQAIEAIDRKSYETARLQLKQALDEMPIPAATARSDDYDATADFAASIDECYRAIRERVAAGGPGWGGWRTDVRGHAGGQARQQPDPRDPLAAQDRAAPVPAQMHRRA